MALDINKLEETKGEAEIIAGINRIVTEEMGAMARMKTSYEEAFIWFWKDPVNICAFLGTEAYKFFQRSDTWRQAIMLVEPAYVPPTVPYEVTFNADGSVTIGDLIPVPEPTPTEPAPEEPVV